MRPPKVLWTIAGFDPSSGAGVTADLATFASHGGFGCSCITALTVQSTRGVKGMQVVTAETVAETLACLENDLPADGIKIGMLAEAGIVGVVADFLETVKGRGVPVVLDPVIRSSSGRDLLDAAGLELLKDRLLPLVDWVTPNLEELAELSGMRVGSRAEVVAAARALQARYPGLTVMATGGHHDPPDDLVLEAGGKESWLAGVRVESRATHGTGCALSSALVAELVAGKGAVEAARAAKAYVVEAIRQGPGLGAGHGPMGLYWPLVL